MKKLIYILVFILSISLVSATTLTSYYDFNSNVLDQEGSNDGTNVGVDLVQVFPTFNGTGDGGNGSGLFEGGGDTVEIDHNFGLNDGSNWTISLWFNSTHTYLGGGSSGFMLQFNEEAPLSVRFPETNFVTTIIKCFGTTTELTTSDVELNDGLWHHWVSVFNNTHSYAYVDGIKQADVDVCGSPLGIQNTKSVMGSDEGLAGFFFGNMDEVKIWSDEALNESQIIELFENGSLTAPAPPPVIVPVQRDVRRNATSRSIIYYTDWDGNGFYRGMLNITNSAFLAQDEGNVFIGNSSKRDSVTTMYGNLNVTNNIIIDGLVGSITGGNDTLCIFANGTIYTSNGAC